MLATLLYLCLSLGANGQGEEEGVRKAITSYFASYETDAFNSNDPIRATNVSIDPLEQSITVTANEWFGAQPFTQAVIRRIYSDIASRLPSPYNSYSISVLCGTQPIEELVTQEWNDNALPLRHWGDIEYRGRPWVSSPSRPYGVAQGLSNVHIALWASHGKYFDLPTGTWKWQRPRLFCTMEDIFTQSIVVPFLMPMLENAGAVLLSPRERDWQRNEAVTDNDTDAPPQYIETAGRHAWQTAWGGFAMHKSFFLDKETPFGAGTYRYAPAVPNESQASSVTWTPDIPEEGSYAVYVSYATLPNSVADATYTVRHKGTATVFKVNQTMGGGTWAYLGTFSFAKGNSPDNCVTLSNVSDGQGVVTADAVRFGGGMGNTARAKDNAFPLLSRLPRYLEGSRYYTQWAGMPYPVYGTKESANDYDEDINSRSLMADYLAGGSPFLPCDSGLNVPIELSLAIHSDAGYRADRSIVGTLGIYTSGNHTPNTEYEGTLAQGLYPAGISRMTSRDLADRIMTSICSDMRATLPAYWTRRQLYDKNYSESRVPDVPGVIIETLAHQNFADMTFGHDPWFKFLLARSIYKGTLRFVAAMHSRPQCTVQPLPVASFSAMLNAKGDSATLRWASVDDPLEAQASPTAYVLYTAQGQADYDNGRLISSPAVTIPVARGQMTRYRVCALNAGGQSLPSEELCVYSPEVCTRSVLIVNGFIRLAGPQPIDNGTLLGFDMDQDPGVVFMHCPCYCGRQTAFDASDLRTLGESGEEYEGLLVAGNTFDYPSLHAADILSRYPNIALSSCSAQAFASGQASAEGFHLVDYILGAQRDDGYSLTSRPCFPQGIRQRLASFAQGGGALLVSGAYLSEELSSPELESFAQTVLHIAPQGTLPIAFASPTAQGMGTSLTVNSDLNEQTFCVKRCSVLSPSQGAFATMLYPSTGQPAAVASDSLQARTLAFGFPLEAIADAQTRRNIITASVQYLIYTK